MFTFPTEANMITRIAILLSQASLVSVVRRKYRVAQKLLFDDDVRALQNSALGMFFYNERAIFFLMGALFVGLLIVLGLTLGANDEMKKTILVLGGAWLVGVLVTFGLHGSFKKRLEKWALSPTPSELPSLFDRYFALDSILILILVSLGRLLGLTLDEFAFLLFADTVIYGAFIGGGRRSRRLITVLVFLTPVITLLLFVGAKIEIKPPVWFYVILYLGPFAGMWFLTTGSVLMISWLRSTEYFITQRRLQLLGEYEAILATPEAEPDGASARARSEVYSEQAFHRQVLKVLEGLCTLGPPYWYRSACLWVLEEHSDRGMLFLPGPRFRFEEASTYLEGMPISSGLMSAYRMALLPSLKFRTQEWEGMAPEFRGELDAPAAFIPLRRAGKQRGVLALYGEEGGAALQRQEGAFLTSLCSILSYTMKQFAGRYRDFPQREMDDLFKRKSLDEVFSEAVRILKDYLMARGCMVVFRPDPNASEMTIAAKDGFSDAIYENKYDVRKGQTGECAELGHTIRRDDVSKHRGKFDPEYLSVFERALGTPLRSWMAIPIGSGEKNYGVIKVVNRTGTSYWFTDYDQKMGEDLALRLQVIIEKFLYIEGIKAATTEAQTQSINAKNALTQAESAAEKRKEDLMVITHQLQAPLSSVIGSISLLRQRLLARDLSERLLRVQDLVEDCLNLSYGTFIAVARDAQRQTSFGCDDLDVPKELRKLCTRLQATNSRPDLRFVYKEDAGFPLLRMDRNVFTSVMYSLIHNAMKYSDEGERVTLECSFERATREAAVKVKSWGEPIHHNERELIFEKFHRGRSVSRGYHHTGVGLGLWVARELMREVGGDITIGLSHDYPRLSVFIVHIRPVEGVGVSREEVTSPKRN